MLLVLYHKKVFSSVLSTDKISDHATSKKKLFLAVF